MTTPTKLLLIILILCPAPRKSLAQIDSCSRFLVPMTVRDARGELVHKLSAGDLEIRAGQTPLQVENVHPETRPRRIVILLDASASMGGVVKEISWPRAVSFAQFLAKLSEGRASLALLIFNNKIVEEIGFASGNPAVTKRLDELQGDQEFLKRSVRGTTHLYDAMSKGLLLLGQPTSADALYVLSDAGENGSRLSFSEIRRQFFQTGVRVFLTDLVNPVQTHRGKSPEEIYGPQDVSKLVEETGGEWMSLAGKEILLGFQTHPDPSITEGVRMFYEGLFANDILELSGPPTNSKKRDLKIGLSSTSASSLIGAQFFYPHQLYVCGASNSANRGR